MLACPMPELHCTPLHRMVHDTDIIELELKSKKFSLNLRKKEALQAQQPVVQVGGGTLHPACLRTCTGRESACLLSFLMQTCCYGTAV